MARLSRRGTAKGADLGARVTAGGRAPRPRPTRSSRTRPPRSRRTGPTIRPSRRPSPSSGLGAARPCSTRCGRSSPSTGCCSIAGSARPLFTRAAGCERVVERLLESGEAYREGDAVWLRTTSRGDDKDRVLIRATDHPTYFAADIAYHEDKLERGFEHLINIWGADHHGYVPRMKAAVEILSGRPGTLEVIIGQLVNLLEEGELRQMSTRRGEMVTLAELIDAIGVDAARFFLVSRSQDQTLDLDIDLARRQSQENPVYYVQYAHARIASIVRNVPEGTAAVIPEGSRSLRVAVRACAHQTSGELRVRRAGRGRAPGAPPHRGLCPGAGRRLPCVLQALPGDRCGAGRCLARLALCLVVRRVIFRCLDLSGRERSREHVGRGGMPELPEVETVRRQLAESLAGATFCAVEQAEPAMLRDCTPRSSLRRDCRAGGSRASADGGSSSSPPSVRGSSLCTSA